MEEHDVSPPLRCVVYAGPNGSGKTSMMTTIENKDISLPDFHLIKAENIVNPDAIANSLKATVESPE